jgi:hypothetical protein
MAVRDTKAFLEAMAMRESSNNPKAVNRFGYMGKYQFHMTTLKTMKVKTTRKQFLANERLQDSVMIVFMRDHWSSMWRMHKWVGKTRHGVKITQSGMLATGHLIGVGGLCAMLEPNRCHYPTKDGNGVSGWTYMQKFAGYKITLPKVKK